MADCATRSARWIDWIVSKIQEEFGGPYPPRTIVEVSRLNQDDLVEVQGTFFYSPERGSKDRA